MTHEDYHFSITVHTDDLAVLHCLRALADYAEKSSQKKIAWGGTTKPNWQCNNNCVVFHFSKNGFREEFKRQARRLLPEASWTLKREADNDPAKPERAKPVEDKLKTI